MKLIHKTDGAGEDIKRVHIKKSKIKINDRRNRIDNGKKLETTSSTLTSVHKATMKLQDNSQGNNLIPKGPIKSESTTHEPAIINLMKSNSEENDFIESCPIASQVKPCINLVGYSDLSDESDDDEHTANESLGKPTLY